MYMLPLYEGFDDILRIWLPKKRRRAVKPRETCPSCRRNLVNLYPKDGQWLCRRCCEELDVKQALAD